MLSNPTYGMYCHTGKNASAPNSARSSRPSPGQQHWLGGDVCLAGSYTLRKAGPAGLRCTQHRGRWHSGRGRRRGYMLPRRRRIEPSPFRAWVYLRSLRHQIASSSLPCRMELLRVTRHRRRQCRGRRRCRRRRPMAAVVGERCVLVY